MQGPHPAPGPLFDENGFSCQLGSWPLETQRVGSRIVHLMNTPGNARNDLIIAKGKVGRIIGPGGSTLKVCACAMHASCCLCSPRLFTESTSPWQALQASHQCDIFMLDKEGPPPGTACPYPASDCIVAGTSRRRLCLASSPTSLVWKAMALTSAASCWWAASIK